jgi:hypothetical protein
LAAIIDNRESLPPSRPPTILTSSPAPALTYYDLQIRKSDPPAAQWALIIHTIPTAGYSWSVVSGCWSNEHPALKLSPDQHGLELSAWWSQEAGAKLTASIGGEPVDTLV